MGIPGVTLPPDPIQLQPTYEGALAAFESCKPVRVLFDNGAGGSAPGQPLPGLRALLLRIPHPGRSKAASWYLAANGRLSGKPPASRMADAFTWNAHALPIPTSGRHRLGLRRTLDRHAQYHWAQNPTGTAVSYLTQSADEGHDGDRRGGRALWVSSSAPNVDLQATVSEVRPDGEETFVQNGWVRGRRAQARPRRESPRSSRS